jgi:signal transduction histidine kinase
MKTKEQKSNSKLGGLLSMVSHDLKSPLTGIMGFADILKTELKKHYPDPIALKCIEEIEMAGTTMQGLVENILTMAKIEAGREQPRFNAIDDLVNEIEQALYVFEVEARAKSVQFQFLYDDDLPIVHWDMEKLRLHVFNNVISNALRFTPMGGRIKVSVKASNGWVTIQIQDNGPGINTKEINSIFEQFKDPLAIGDLSKSRSLGGNGYGLQNAKLFVESHHGKIFAENVNNSYTTGSRFTILLPARPNGN